MGCHDHICSASRYIGSRHLLVCLLAISLGDVQGLGNILRGVLDIVVIQKFAASGNKRQNQKRQIEDGKTKEAYSMFIASVSVLRR